MLNSFYSTTNSYYALYSPRTDFSYFFKNQYHDNSYISNGVDKVLIQSNPSLHFFGLFKHFVDPTFEISSKNEIPCEVELVGW